jgi:hypothetical protein
MSMGKSAIVHEIVGNLASMAERLDTACVARAVERVSITQ